jgi:hypothetical protein
MEPKIRHGRIFAAYSSIISHFNLIRPGHD